MVFLLHGDNRYESWLEALSLYKKHGSKESTLKIYDAEEIKDLSQLFSSSQTFGMFGQSEFIILKRIFKHRSSRLVDEFTQYISNNDITLVLWEESSADKRKKLYKEIKKKGAILEFPLLNRSELEKWINKEATDVQLKLNREMLNILIDNIGFDQYMLASELNKLSLYQSTTNSLTNDNIKEVLSGSSKADIWDLIDTIENKDRKKRKKILDYLFLQGEQPLSILGMLARHFRILIQTRFLYEKGFGEREVQARLKLHPFVIKKAYKNVQGLELRLLKRYYQKLLDTDLAIKEGKIDPELAVTLFIGIL